MKSNISPELTTAITNMTDEMFEGMVAFSQKLIQTPSVSSTEKDVADLNVAEMEKLGYDEVFRDEYGNVVGLVRGTEPGPTIMFNSHLDHVDPGDPGNWEGYDPYGGQRDVCLVDKRDKSGKEESECLHGRAASDVKCGEAVQIYAGGMLAKMKKQGLKFPGTFMYTGVVLEECSECLGMIHLVDKTLPARGLDYDALVSSEATSLDLYCGHRGRTELLITVYGRTSHGSAPWLGINAVYKALPVIQKLKDELYPSLPRDPQLGQSSISLNIISCSPGALSIVPDRCMLSIDRRMIPGENSAIALAQVKKILDDLAAADPEFKADVKVKQAVEHTYTGISCEASKDVMPWKLPMDHPFALACKAALEGMGQTPKFAHWDFATDHSKNAGLDHKPCIGYSPMQEQYAHTPFDKCRTDFMKTALAGNAAIFLNCAAMKKEDFKPI